MVKGSRRGLARLGALLVIGTAMVGAGAATVSYVPAEQSRYWAYLVDTQDGRAQVVSTYGAASGVASGTWKRLTVTLDAPISRMGITMPDRCGVYSFVRRDVQRLDFRVTGGTADAGRSGIGESGSYTFLEGCEVGKSWHFDPRTEGVFEALHRDMAARASVADLVPGAQLAGMTEHWHANGDPDWAVAVDIVQFLPGSRLRFETTGRETGAAWTSDEWLVLNLSAFQRAYARLTVDNVTGAETWLEADLIDGAPRTVRRALMTKPVAGATFGTVAQAARVWEGGLFVGTNEPFYIELYRDRTGSRVSKYLPTGTETRQPITWRFVGNDIYQQRDFAGMTGQRHWQPISNRGPIRWVIESEPLWDGFQWIEYIPARVNAYVDRGPATPAVAGTAASAAPRMEAKGVRR